MHVLVLTIEWSYYVHGTNTIIRIHNLHNTLSNKIQENEIDGVCSMREAKRNGGKPVNPKEKEYLGDLSVIEAQY